MGIVNERAEKLPKSGRKLSFDVQVDNQDFFSQMKKNCAVLKEWVQSLQFKGVSFELAQQFYSSDLWYRKFCFLERRHCTTFIRLRMEHECYPQYLPKITMKDNPKFECRK